MTVAWSARLLAQPDYIVDEAEIAAMTPRGIS